MRPRRAAQHGISLIEALVAVAIMGFGMLGVLGMQATLRSNSDISKQRSEAVRIAQAAMETHRGYSVLDTTPGLKDYASINSAAAAAAAQLDANAAFQRTDTVLVYPATISQQDYLPQFKSVVVDVSWEDRSNVTQSVRISSIIAGISPEIAAALVAPGEGAVGQNPGGRSRTVPVSAIDLGNGTSKFIPPGASPGVSWIFTNRNGVIKQTCLGNVCTDFGGRLLSGYVRFATDLVQPSYVESRNPPDAVATSGTSVNVTLTEPSSSVVACYQSPFTTLAYVAYFCALPVGTVDQWWSGRATVDGLPLATSISPADVLLYRVCRYTTSRWNTSTPVVANQDHPYDYSTVKNSLTDQNFLVIRAGNGSTPFSCPDDSIAVGRTMDHQP